MMAKSLMNPRKAAWTFVLKFKVCRGDRSIEAIKVLSTPSWGPAVLASLFVLGALSVFGVANALRGPGPNEPVLSASMIPEPELQPIAPAQTPSGDLHHAVPTRGGEDAARDVITPLNVRDPSALVMGPARY